MYAFLHLSLSLFLGTTHHLPPLPPCVFCAPCSVYCNILCSDCVTFFAFLFAWIWLSTVHSTDRTLPKNILDLSVVSCYLSSRCPISQSSSSSSHVLLRLLLQAFSVYTW